MRQAVPEDLGSFVAVLAPGQMSPRATKYKETIRGFKKLCVCEAGANYGQNTEKTKKPNCHFWWAGSKIRGCSCPLHSTQSKEVWGANHLRHPFSPLDQPWLSPHVTNQFSQDQVASNKIWSLLSLPSAAAVKALVAQPCLTLCDPMDGSLPGSSVHGILQTRILEWVAMPSSRGFFPTQGLSPSLLHWQGDYLPSEPLEKQGPP